MARWRRHGSSSFAANNLANARRVKTYTTIVETCPDTDLYVGHVPSLPGVHSQAESLDELNGNLREVIGLLLEDSEPQLKTDSFGTK